MGLLWVGLSIIHNHGSRFRWRSNNCDQELSILKWLKLKNYNAPRLSLSACGAGTVGGGGAPRLRADPKRSFQQIRTIDVIKDNRSDLMII